jgi:hypothetical protein
MRPNSFFGCRQLCEFLSEFLILALQQEYLSLTFPIADRTRSHANLAGHFRHASASFKALQYFGNLTRVTLAARPAAVCRSISISIPIPVIVTMPPAKSPHWWQN